MALHANALAALRLMHTIFMKWHSRQKIHFIVMAKCHAAGRLVATSYELLLCLLQVAVVVVVVARNNRIKSNNVIISYDEAFILTPLM